MPKTIFEQKSIEAVDNARKLIKNNEGLAWDDEVSEGKMTLKEMIGTSDGAESFLEKVTYDLYQGREDVPLVYKAIYTTQTDANFPKTLTLEEFGPVQVVFLEKFEGGEVVFGALGPGLEKTVRFATYAAGIEYDEDIIEYNQTWRVSEITVAFGEAYNKLLNHLHMNPIISATYTTTGGGLSGQHTAQYDPNTPVAQLVPFDTSIEKTLQNAMQVLPNGSILIHNTFDLPALESALASAMLPDLSPSALKSKIRPENFIAYDGDSVTVEKTTYNYAGVAQGDAYLVVPKKNFRELIKHDLRVDSDDGDLSRLILSQVVGRARRAVAAVLADKNGAVKVKLQ